MKRRILYGLLVFFLLIAALPYFTGCTTQKPVSDPKDLSYLYNPLKNSIYPRYRILNQSENTSILSVKFISSELFFNEANPMGVPMATLLISIRLYNTSQGRTLADTALYNIDIVRDTLKKEYLYRLPLKVEKGNDYVAEIKVIDKIRQFAVQSFVSFNTLSEFNRYNYFLRGHSTGNEVMLPVIRKNEYFNLVYPRGNIDSIFISVYKPYKKVPYPPSMLLPEIPVASEPDTIVALPYSESLPLMFPKEGIYFFTPGRDLKEGYALFNFGNDFPLMKNPEAMIEPLAYLASPDEMAELSANPRLKVALDNFWIGCGGNIDKARELIRIFYTRVVYANYYFSSFKEGWRTDRGMIYIIYGPPDKLYKSNDEESWGYRKSVVKSNWGSWYTVKDDYMFFTFKKRQSMFSDNEFSLTRSETVVTYWDKAVLAWRSGKVFRLDDPADL